MNTIILLFILPIGLVFLYYERKSTPKYMAIFDSFLIEVDTHKDYTDQEKLSRIDNMLHLNGYKTTRTKSYVQGEKKIYSVGAIFVGLGFIYVGAILYLLYVKYIKKPHIVRYDVSNRGNEVMG